LRIRDIAELPLIMPAFPHANRRVLEQAAVQHGVHLRIALEVDSVTLTKALVRRGLGYSLLTYTAIQEEVARGELRASRSSAPPSGAPCRSPHCGSSAHRDWCARWQRWSATSTRAGDQRRLEGLRVLAGQHRTAR
jgi:DNA-binding transcriptional LysR family regulator